MNSHLLILFISIIDIQATSNLVPDLNPHKFQNITARKEGATLVMFYTPWCPHCQSAKPIFLNAAKKMAEINQSNRLALMNCDDESNSQFCTTQNIEGYPTIKLFTANNETHIFNAESTEENFIKFFTDPSQMSESMTNEQDTPDVPFKNTPYLDVDNFNNTLKEMEHALVFFYAPWCPHCQDVKPKLEKASEKLSAKSRAIYAVNCELKNSKKICDDEKVEGFPTIRYYHLGEMFAEYDDRMETNSFLEYLSKPPKEKVPITVPETEHSSEDSVDSEKMTHVRYVTNDDFDGLLKQHKDQIMVMYFIPMCSHCKDAKPIYDSLAKEFSETKQKVLLAAINCAEKTNEKLCEKEKISGFPTFIHYNRGKRVEEYIDTPITKEKLTLYFSSKAKDEL